MGLGLLALGFLGYLAIDVLALFDVFEGCVRKNICVYVRGGGDEEM